jgi:hypothetical protein
VRNQGCDAAHIIHRELSCSTLIPPIYWAPLQSGVSLEGYLLKAFMSTK